MFIEYIYLFPEEAVYLKVFLFKKSSMKVLCICVSEPAYESANGFQLRSKLSSFVLRHPSSMRNPSFLVSNKHIQHPCLLYIN